MDATWKWAIFTTFLVQILILKVAALFPGLSSLIATVAQSSLLLILVWALQKSNEEGLAKDFLRYAAANWTVRGVLLALVIVSMFLAPVQVECRASGTLNLDGQKVACEDGESHTVCLRGWSRSVLVTAGPLRGHLRISPVGENKL